MIKIISKIISQITKLIVCTDPIVNPKKCRKRVKIVYKPFQRLDILNEAVGPCPVNLYNNLVGILIPKDLNTIKEDLNITEDLTGWENIPEKGNWKIVIVPKGKFPEEFAEENDLC